MSWQVRLGDLDEEIQEFIEKNDEFSGFSEKKFVKHAVREYIKEYKREKKLKDDKIEEYIDNKVNEALN